MKGNNGRIYRTVCLAGIEVMADNLCETRFRDGTLIPEALNAAGWAADASAKMAPYAYNWNYV